MLWSPYPHPVKLEPPAGLSIFGWTSSIQWRPSCWGRPSLQLFYEAQNPASNDLDALRHDALNHAALTQHNHHISCLGILLIWQLHCSSMISKKLVVSTCSQRDPGNYKYTVSIPEALMMPKASSNARLFHTPLRWPPTPQRSSFRHSSNSHQRAEALNTSKTCHPNEKHFAPSGAHWSSSNRPHSLVSNARLFPL